MAYKKATRLVKFLQRSLVWPADVPDLDVRVLELIGEFRNKDSLMLTKNSSKLGKVKLSNDLWLIHPKPTPFLKNHLSLVILNHFDKYLASGNEAGVVQPGNIGDLTLIVSVPDFLKLTLCVFQ